MRNRVQEIIYSSTHPITLSPSQPLRRIIMRFLKAYGLFIAGLVGLGLLAGCGGGQDYSKGLARNLGGDIGNNYGGTLGSQYRGPNGKQAAGMERGAYPMIETSFQLANVPGDPF